MKAIGEAQKNLVQQASEGSTVCLGGGHGEI